MEIKLFKEIPNQLIMNSLLQLHECIFEDTTLAEKLKQKPKILIIVALKEAEVVGYKIGYEIDNKTFYSWYGGVHEEYRGQGIAEQLMKRQHQTLIEAGYHIVQTKTRNKWRNMLILNIKHGFDIVETFTDQDGIHRIVLEKTLSEK